MGSNIIRKPDCVTEIRRGNTILVVNGYYKQDTTVTAVDKMLKAMEKEAVIKYTV